MQNSTNAKILSKFFNCIKGSKPRMFSLLPIIILSLLILQSTSFAQYQQQGSKLVGTRASGNVYEGHATALSSDGNTSEFSATVKVTQTTSQTFVVTNTNDSGTGSLRQAILDANSNPNESSSVRDTITFNIPGSGAFTISPVTALPAITDPVVINGLSQTGASPGNLMIVLNGASAPSTAGGLTISAGNTTIQGLVINGFGHDGIYLQTAGSDTVKQNYIGTDITGKVSVPNHWDGIFITGSNNIIGGALPNEGNLISGNSEKGIYIHNESSGNKVEGNYIGVDITGNSALPNSQSGIVISGSNNIIGGSTTIERNIISGNKINGIGLTSVSSTGNNIIGNYIGTNYNGTAAIGNVLGGVVILSNSNSNIVGGSSGSEGNLISGNKMYGVYIDSTCGSNNVLGNLIGTDVTGTVSIPNLYGIYIYGPNNIIGGTNTNERNLISGNSQEGIYIESLTAYGNKVIGNYIGTDINGTKALGNVDNGVFLDLGPHDNIIGGSSPGSGNLISGNKYDGILMVFSGNNKVQGNLIGTDLTGTAAIPNNIGISILYFNNIIGGDVPAERNIISGNNLYGIDINSSLAHGNKIIGNYIGTNINGTEALGNVEFGILIEQGALDNIIGGSASGDGNLISGNKIIGVNIDNKSNSNKIQGNLIGSDKSGTDSIPNMHSGVVVSGPNNIIGGTTAAERNLISGNHDSGIVLTSSNSTGNQVIGNYIGTDVNGTAKLENTVYGVLFYAGAHNNIIGGAGSGMRNIISGNGSAGIACGTDTTGNNIIGNYIGTDITGKSAVPNGQVGIYIDGSNNIIGGTSAGEGNIVSGNNNIGILINSGSGNKVMGNYVGTDISGTNSIPNLHSGVVVKGSNNIIGGTTAAERNLISGNHDSGIVLSSSTATGNQVIGNYIGTDVNGTAKLENTAYGVYIYPGAHNNIIGGTASGMRNIISGNGSFGIVAFGTGTTGNKIIGNYIGTDVNGKNALGNDSTGVLLAPEGGNIVGGKNTGEGNIIAFNNGSGVAILDGSSLYGKDNNNPVLGNSIFANKILGIDLGRDGVTPNDPTDADTGANKLQNYPVINLVQKQSNGNLTIIYFVSSSAANSVYPLRIEFFKSEGGQGKTFLGAQSYTSANAEQLVTQTFTPASAIAGGDSIVATATDADGNTSEFSAAIKVTQTITSQTFIVTNTYDSGTGSLRQAILDANSHQNESSSIRDTIAFNIPGSGPFTIAPATALPTITDPVVIDGFSQPGASPGALKIILSGTSIPNTSTTNKLSKAEGKISLQEILKNHSKNTAASSVSGLTVNSGNSVIQGLVINGFSYAGIELNYTGGNNTVRGNFIGTGITGTSAIPNMYAGVRIDGPNNIIGGTTSADRNLISGNPDGIEIISSTATENKIIGNYIGTDLTGSIALGNYYGVLVGFGAYENTVGGNTAAQRNIISGNSEGIVFVGGGKTNNKIIGNYIGTDETGGKALGNTLVGIDLEPSGNNSVGGTSAGEGNVIAWNNGPGVFISAGNNLGKNNNNPVLGNSIFSNKGLGIDLSVTDTADGITPNDPADADTGANKLQNFPDISLINITNSHQLSIAYSVSSSTVNSTYPLRIEIFKSQGGQGKTFLGALSYDSVNAEQQVTQFLTPLASTGVGDSIVATATDSNGNTSEFSLPVSVTSLLNTVNITFEADMTDLLSQGFNPAKDSIEVRGNIPPLNWAPGIIMQQDLSDTTLFKVTIKFTAQAGIQLQWKFHCGPEALFVNNGWDNTSNNRTLSIPKADTTVGPLKPAVQLLNPTDVKNTNHLPTEFSLGQNYPNPFNPSTTIQYQIPKASHVSLKIYNMLGEVVNELVNKNQNAGYYSVQWKPDLPSGVYIYRLIAKAAGGSQAKSFVEIKKLILLK